MNKTQRTLKAIIIYVAIMFFTHAGVAAATEVLVAGHKNPDTDSICSAIGYAKLEQLLGIDAIAIRVGEINNETQYVLNYFGVTVPPLVKLIGEKQKIVLVDYNELGQGIAGLEETEIVGVVDHHRLGGLKTENPIPVRIEAVGCAATIVANEYWQYKFEIPKNIAGLLLSAIISDTVLFRSVTTTAADKETAGKLAEIAGVNINKYGLKMLKAGENYDLTPDQIVRNDMKEYEVNGRAISISQISFMDTHEVLAQKEQLLTALEKMRASGKYEASFLMVTNIVEMSTHFLFQGNADNIIKLAFGKEIDNCEVYLPNVMSRKDQIVPPLLTAARELMKNHPGVE